MVYCTMYIHSTLYVRKSVCLHKTKSGFTQWTVSTGHILRIIPSKFNKENSDKQQQRPTTTKTNGGKLIENISIIPFRVVCAAHQLIVCQLQQEL